MAKVAVEWICGIKKGRGRTPVLQYWHQVPALDVGLHGEVERMDHAQPTQAGSDVGIALVDAHHPMPNNLKFLITSLKDCCYYSIGCGGVITR